MTRAARVSVLTPAVLLLIPVALWPQGGRGRDNPDAVKQGEQVFAKTCSVGYCHGTKGGVGGAPRLVSRGFNREYIDSTVRHGIAGTAMPAFENTLSQTDLRSVIAYVGSLNGLAAGGASAEAKPLPAQAERGRALFYEAVRGFGRCSTCHEIGGVGIPVAAPIAKAPADARVLRAFEATHVSTATLGGESMPALVVSRGKSRTVLFDLTSAPPVLRTVDSAEVQVKEGSTWKHSAALSSYNDAELGAIVTYLKAVVQ